MSKGYTNLFRWQREKQKQIKTRLFSEGISQKLKDFRFIFDDDDWSGTVEVKTKE